MGSRFSKRIKLFPGFRLNFGKRGVSATIGRQGASFGIGRQGVHSNIGIKGTGLSFRTKLNNTSKVYSHESMLIKYLINDDHHLVFVNQDGNQISPILEKKFKKANLPELIAYLNDYADEYNHELFLCTNQHLLSPSPDDNLFQVPEFEIQKPAKPEFKKAGFFEKLFRQEQKITRQNNIMQETYDTQLASWNKAYNQYLKKKKSFLEQLYLAQSGDVAAMEKTLEYLMNEIQWEKETSVSFEIDSLHHRLLIDIDLPEIEDIPNKKATAVERGLKVNIKNKTSKETKDDYINCVFSILFRATGLCFSALPTIQEILISGYTQRANQKNGHIENVYIVSAIVERTLWNNINFKALDNINPFLCFQQFKLNCHANRKGELCQIEPLDFIQ